MANDEEIRENDGSAMCYILRYCLFCLAVILCVPILVWGWARVSPIYAQVGLAVIALVIIILALSAINPPREHIIIVPFKTDKAKDQGD